MDEQKAGAEAGSKRRAEATHTDPSFKGTGGLRIQRTTDSDHRGGGRGPNKGSGRIGRLQRFSGVGEAHRK